MAVYRDPVKKTWYCKFRYTDWQGKSHVTTKRGFRTQREAKAYEAEKQSKVSPENTLSEVVTAYLNDRKPNVKHSTYIAIKRAIENFICPSLGDKQLKDITPKLVRDWQLSIQKYVSTTTGRRMKGSTLRVLCGHLSAVLAYAVRYYGLPSNPMQLVGKIGRLESSQNFWTLEQYKTFSATLPEDLRLFFDVLFYSGMRLGEFLALAPTDIDYAKRTITISKSVMRSTNTITTPKNAHSNRTIPMPHTIIERIKNYAARYYDTPERLFQTSHLNMDRAIKKYAAIAGLPVIHVHDLRHSHASLLIHQGTPITAISHRLGHASPATTLRIYSHMYAEAQEEIADMLDSL